MFGSSVRSGSIFYEPRFFVNYGADIATGFHEYLSKVFDDELINFLFELIGNINLKPGVLAVMSRNLNAGGNIGSD